ncbi:MAG: heavy metal translocating P-type ATPase, partial [Lachnospiraceae bacterium]|nr:heavy metal translocating P-type ATPase [Lachnospiraceae bacterium]
ISGEAGVNQASMTGESLPVHKEAGGYVYAGTVVDEGELVIEVKKASGEGQYDRIISMIEESEKLKSETESKAARLADRLVPYSLGATALTYLLTRNITKATSILMVDFCCALKLSMPIAVLSAMKEAGEHSISVKGGKFLERVAEANTIIFDKTGTVTKANPVVKRVIALNGQDENEMLRLAACLEEHYPHSMANAVVKAAEEKGLTHEEKHARVEYVVAHGIASSIDGKKVVIGSRHFIFDDECCEIAEGEEQIIKELSDEYSHLYMAMGGVLSAVIEIEDPLKESAVRTIKGLHELGFEKVVMLTGDNEKTAARIAGMIGADDYCAEVLPSDKADYIRSEHEAGRKVIMVGDGVNDSPALSEADVGIAINTGAAIAREVADITISDEDLMALLTLRRLSTALMRRIRSNYRFIIGFNSMLILLGAAGVLQPRTSALLHNGSTIAIGLKSMTGLLDR